MTFPVRASKRRTDGNMKLMEKELTHSKEQAIVTASHYAAVETDSNMLRNENRMYMRINHKLQIMTRKKE